MTPVALAQRIGLDRSGRGFRGTCPGCGYTQAFSVSPGRDGRSVFFCFAGCGYRDLSDKLARVAGDAWQPPTPDPKHVLDRTEARAAARARALSLWESSVPAAGTLAARYLAGRCIASYAGSAALRFRANCRHPEGGTLPAMIALVTDAAGAPMAVHRHYLDPVTGGKAKVEPAKATLGSPWGGTVRLALYATEMVIGEGIETAAAAGVLLNLPAWSAINAGNLAKALVLPSTVRSVVIAVDRDQAGERAARDAAVRWRAEGRAVRLMIPDRAGTDAADVLRERETKNA